MQVSVRTAIAWSNWTRNSRWWSPVNTDDMTASAGGDGEPWGPKVIPAEAQVYEYGGDRFSQNSAIDPHHPGTGDTGATRGLTIPIMTRLDGADTAGISFVLAAPSAKYDDTAHSALSVSTGR